MIDASLFGDPRVRLDGEAVRLPVRKTLALFAYLVVEGHASRAQLAELFWPQLDEATARRNLRRGLHRLRASGLGDAIAADDDTVAVAAVRSDASEFRQAIRAMNWGTAQGLYTGVFCDGLQIDDAPAFEDWLQTQREHFRRAWCSAAVQQAQALEAGGRLQAAMALHERLLQADKLQESSYRHLMRLQDALGDRAAALAVMQRCERTLREELGLEPLPETLALADQIRARAAQAGMPAATAVEPARPADTALDFRLLPLVARERELAAVIAGQGPLFLIVGDAGVGKSRLAAEACRRMAGDTAAILVVRFTEMSSATPFHGVADALRAPAMLERLAGLDSRWRRELARLLPELRAGRGPVKAEATSPAEARSRLLEALARALAWVRNGSASLLFDDLHQADASSLELLSHLARRRAQEPALFPKVVATARAHELTRNAAAVNALEEIERHPGLARLTLGAFDASAMLQLVQTLSGHSGGVRFAARLGAATGGNAFFALETIRALLEAGELQADPRQGWHTRYDDTTANDAELPLPASVIEAVRARVARLGPAARRLLETAALADDGSTLDAFKSATALNDWEALDGIERAVDAQVLVRAGGGYRFAHELFRAAIRSGLSPERQRLTHAKLAAALEPVKASAARVAAHWQAAGETRAAALAWVRAAEEAVAVHAHSEASGHYERAARLTADEEAAFALDDLAFNSLAMATLDRERRAMIDRLLVRAQQASSPVVRFRVLVRAAHSASLDRDHASTERFALEGLQRFEPPNAAFHIHALSCAAFAAGHLDRRADALLHYREALLVARKNGIARAVTMMAAAASRCAVYLDRLEEAGALRDEALAIGDPVGGGIPRAQALSNGSFLSRALGQRGEAVAHLQEAATIARATRSDPYLQIYLANLCETLVDDGQLAAARVTLQELVSLFPDPATSLARYLTSLTAAVVEELQGNLGAAIDAARTAISAADALGDLADRREARLLAARLVALTGASALAQPWVDEADTLVQPGWCGTMLPSACFHAGLLVEKDPEAVQLRLGVALANPCADRLMHPYLETARILLGRCALAPGRPASARALVAHVRHSMALESQALAVQLAAAGHDGEGLQEAMDAGLAMIDRACLPPADALALMRALSTAARPGQRRQHPLAGRLRPRMRTVAQTLADSLRGSPALQSAWIRQHRDLLT